MGPKINYNTEFEKLNKLIADIKSDLEGKATTNQLDKLFQEIRAKNEKIELLESKVAVLENAVNLLKQKCDDNEQYSRRMSLRITNIALEPNENASKCVEMAVNTLNKIEGVDLQKAEIDRAHRVGASRENIPRQMIVKFKDWNTRANVYKNRRSLNDNKEFVDLTKRRFSLKMAAINKVRDLDDVVDYVFSDINCRLCAKLNNGEFKYFNSEDEFNVIISSLTSRES